jgi:hypothetical protein
MKVLKRDKNRSKWSKLNKVNYYDEAELQKLISVDPEIIPVKEISEDRKSIKVAIQEFGLSDSGYADIVGIDEDGQITLIEVKLKGNSEIKRRVVGQILDYAASLWKSSYKDFNDDVEEYLGKSLIEVMSENIDKPDWSKERFERTVEANLKKGNFTLFIIVDKVDDNLRRILEFINSSSFSGPQIYAWAVGYYKDNSENEFLIPQIYGVNIKEIEVREERTSRGSWNYDDFFDKLCENVGKQSTELVKKLYDGVKAYGRIDFGSGKEEGSWTLKIPYKNENGSPRSLMQVWTTGEFYVITPHFISKGDEYLKRLFDNYKKKIIDKAESASLQIYKGNPIIKMDTGSLNEESMNSLVKIYGKIRKDLVK